jgi:putative FmdB family regulatory protein
MPVYEFRCGNCGERVEMLVRSFEEQEFPCPFCKGNSLKRVMSAFAYHRSEGDRLAGLDTRRPHDADYYRDDRNIGLWAKKRMKELGFDPGKEFDGVIEKTREKVADELGG